MIAIFSALRLAKFNIDENQSDSFIGLPTPANALFLTSLIFLPDPLNHWLSSGAVLLICTGVFSLLLVSPFELFALKFKNFLWKQNQIRFVFLGLAVFAIVILKESSIPFIILFYIFVSLLTAALKLK